MPQREAGTRGGSADIGLILPGVLLVAALLTRQPVVAERIWRHFRTYPDLVAIRADAVLSSWPLRSWAARLLDHAEAAAWAAKTATNHGAEVVAFLRAQALAVGSSLVLEVPSFLLLAVGGWALGRFIRGFEAPASVDLADRLVLLEIANLGPPTFELPEMELPFPPAVASKDGWTEEDHEDFARLRELAARSGLKCVEISRQLAVMPIARAARLRAALRAEAGMSDLDLEAYRQGRLWKPRHWSLRRLRRAGISPRFLEAREALRRIGGLTPLRERLLRIAAAHAAWPASIDHHGSEDGGLLEHRASILLEAIELVRSGAVSPEDREALLTMAVAHDGGKWISFGRDGKRWLRYDGLHAQHTADILRSLPELAEDHGPDAERIVLSLDHEYSSDNLPEDFRAACRRLMRPIKDIERIVVPAEETSTAAIDRAVEEVIGVLPRVVSEMSINRATGDWQAHGIYEGETERGEEVLLVLEAALRYQLRDYLGQPSQKALGLWRDRPPGKLHPGFAAIASALLACGAIPREARKIPVTEAMPLVTLKSGKKMFRGAFPISLRWLAGKMEAEDLVHLKDGWGARGWEITILGPGVNVPNPPPGKAPATRLPTDKPAPDLPKPESDSPKPVAEAPKPAPPPPPAAKPEAPAKPPSIKCPACRRLMKPVRGGTVVVCIGTFRRRCDVKFRVKDGAVVTTCPRCGKTLVPVRPEGRPAFVGCPDPTCKNKEPKPDA